jgi:pSer/pThr/pTyr-binding forkhead associated (FHA) protein
MIRRLVFLDPAGTWQIPFEGPRLAFGRDEENEIVLDDPRVSHHHALLELRGDAVWIVDLDSNAGVLLNGVKVFRSSPLSNRDVLRIGAAKIRFIEESEEWQKLRSDLERAPPPIA